MSLVDKFRKLPTQMIFLHIFTKVLIGLGLGVVFADKLQGYGWWIVLAGVVLSIPPFIVLFKEK